MAANNTRVWDLRRSGFPVGWMMSPNGFRRPVRDGYEPMPFAIDNGLFFPLGGPPKGDTEIASFYKMLKKLRWEPLFVTVPDRPYSAEITRDMFPCHAAKIREEMPGTRLAMAVQDGMDESDVDLFPAGPCALFVAGSTEWKIRTMPAWSRIGHERGIYTHIARVNTARRLQLVIDQQNTPGCRIDSVDGTGIWRGDKRQLKGVLDALVQRTFEYECGKAVAS